MERLKFLPRVFPEVPCGGGGGGGCMRGFLEICAPIPYIGGGGGQGGEGGRVGRGGYDKVLEAKTTQICTINQNVGDDVIFSVNWGKM